MYKDSKVILNVFLLISFLCVCSCKTFEIDHAAPDVWLTKVVKTEAGDGKFIIIKSDEKFYSGFLFENNEGLLISTGSFEESESDILYKTNRIFGLSKDFEVLFKEPDNQTFTFNKVNENSFSLHVDDINEVVIFKKEEFIDAKKIISVIR